MSNLYRAHKFKSEVTKIGSFNNPYLDTPRLPVTTPLFVHNVCDAWFDSRFQTRFRSRALFGTGSVGQARTYLGDGAVLLKIWPIGAYKMCFSPFVYDLFDHFVVNLAGQQPTSETIEAELETMGYRFFENTGLDEAISSGCEVMLVANTFGYEIL